MKKQCPYLINQDKHFDLPVDFASPGIVQYFVIDTVTVSLYYMSRGADRKLPVYPSILR